MISWGVHVKKYSIFDQIWGILRNFYAKYAHFTQFLSIFCQFCAFFSKILLFFDKFLTCTHHEMKFIFAQKERILIENSTFLHKISLFYHFLAQFCVIYAQFGAKSVVFRLFFNVYCTWNTLFSWALYINFISNLRILGWICVFLA